MLGYWAFGGPWALDVDDAAVDASRTPSRLDLGPPSPNPSAREVRFALALPAEARVVLVVHDLQGRLVGRVESGRLAPGSHALAWDARDVGAGVYFARLLVDGRCVAIRRAVIVR